jgi:hypothetical protein
VVTAAGAMVSALETFFAVWACPQDTITKVTDNTKEPILLHIITAKIVLNF